MLTRTAIAIVILIALCSPFAAAGRVEINEHSIHVDMLPVGTVAHPNAPVNKKDTGDLESTGNIVVDEGQTVNDVSTVGGSITVRGHVTSDASAVGGGVIVEKTGRVDGDATAVGGNVVVKKGGHVAGDVSVVAGKVIREPGSVVGGGTTSVGPPSVGKWFPHWGWTWLRAPHWIWRLGTIVLFALLAAVVVALFPQRMETVASAVVEKPGWSFIYAIIGALLVVPVMILLILTIVGIPLIAVEFLALAAAWIAGSIAVGLAVGRKLSEAVGEPISSAVLAAMVGTLLLGLVNLVPFAGGLLIWILSLFGFGAVLMTGFGSHPDWVARRFQNRNQPPPPAPPAPPTTPYEPGTDVEPA